VATTVSQVADASEKLPREGLIGRKIVPFPEAVREVKISLIIKVLPRPSFREDGNQRG
jgi:hypothetical protein